jgi:hypothetical protein
MQRPVRAKAKPWSWHLSSHTLKGTVVTSPKKLRPSSVLQDTMSHSSVMMLQRAQMEVLLLMTSKTLGSMLQYLFRHTETPPMMAAARLLPPTSCTQLHSRVTGMLVDWKCLPMEPWCSHRSSSTRIPTRWVAPSSTSPPAGEGCAEYALSLDVLPGTVVLQWHVQ